MEAGRQILRQMSSDDIMYVRYVVMVALMQADLLFVVLPGSLEKQLSRSGFCFLGDLVT